jgi:predicted nucleic acid-binding Zn ribbon protein
MECPYCHEALPSKTCPSCGEEIPEESRYCLACGIALGMEGAPDDSDDEEGLDLENRILCPDGTCTGIIENGRCTVCGKALDEHEADPPTEDNEPGS